MVVYATYKARNHLTVTPLRFKPVSNRPNGQLIPDLGSYKILSSN